MTLRTRPCRCCGKEVGHDGWLNVCNDPECVRKGMRDHAMSKHLKIRPAGAGCYLVFVVQERPYGVTISTETKAFLAQTDSTITTAVYFTTETEAKEFVARVRAGISNAELHALIEAHCLPPEHITVEELRRRAKADE